MVASKKKVSPLLRVFLGEDVSVPSLQQVDAVFGAKPDGTGESFLILMQRYGKTKFLNKLRNLFVKEISQLFDQDEVSFETQDSPDSVGFRVVFNSMLGSSNFFRKCEFQVLYREDVDRVVILFRSESLSSKFEIEKTYMIQSGVDLATSVHQVVAAALDAVNEEDSIS